MTRRSLSLIIFALLAAAAAAVFLALSVDHDVYAPGARDVSKAIAHHTHVRRAERELPPVAQRWLAPTRILRKAYSIVAFAIVGFFVAPLARRRSRLLVDAAIVAAFSTLIEVVQKLSGSHEGYACNAFDIFCGAAGGALGALAWDALMRRRVRADAVR